MLQGYPAGDPSNTLSQGVSTGSGSANALGVVNLDSLDMNDLNHWPSAQDNLTTGSQEEVQYVRLSSQEFGDLLNRKVNVDNPRKTARPSGRAVTDRPAQAPAQAQACPKPTVAAPIAPDPTPRQPLRFVHQFGPQVNQPISPEVVQQPAPQGIQQAAPQVTQFTSRPVTQLTPIAQPTLNPGPTPVAQQVRGFQSFATQHTRNIPRSAHSIHATSAAQPGHFAPIAHNVQHSRVTQPSLAVEPSGSAQTPVQAPVQAHIQYAPEPNTRHANPDVLSATQAPRARIIVTLDHTHERTPTQPQDDLKTIVTIAQLLEANIRWNRMFEANGIIVPWPQVDINPAIAREDELRDRGESEPFKSIVWEYAFKYLGAHHFSKFYLQQAESELGNLGTGYEIGPLPSWLYRYAGSQLLLMQEPAQQILTEQQLMGCVLNLEQRRQRRAAERALERQQKMQAQAQEQLLMQQQLLTQQQAQEQMQVPAQTQPPAQMQPSAPIQMPAQMQVPPQIHYPAPTQVPSQARPFVPTQVQQDMHGGVHRVGTERRAARDHYNNTPYARK
ncbi:hypothetical protein CTheo_2756 [Ceratobasidium theobromae]|uniref:Uncharacterized protein n=1 Tax=Ceratobasidium theobromae TaxID=1582974 RepID=A0A5N5QRD4_9AGAM|nr:hypothetical protein CTheo_2756 [Ceratobasidium theobromae]